MWVEQAQDARSFAVRAHARLERFPVESNVLATWLQLALEADAAPRGRSWWWLLFEDPARPDDLAGIAFQSEGFPLQLAPMTGQAAAALAQHYASTGLDPRGVSGVDECARDFAQAWQRITGAGYRAAMAMRIYALTMVAPVVVGGSARRAGEADLELCETWLTAFASEALPDERRDTVRAMAERRLRAGQLWLWIDGGRPVSLAGLTAVVAGVARVGPVYTPPVFRRAGYGAAITAAVSQVALDAGAERCMLYSDLANPVSNSIYPRLGYRVIADAVRYSFAAAPPPFATPPDDVPASPDPADQTTPPTLLDPQPAAAADDPAGPAA